MSMIERPSPNFDARPDDVGIDILLLHYTGMASGPAAIDRLCDPAAKVSSHYVVEEDGRVFRLVPEEMRAWHAGVSSWMGATNINARSIGIEIVNGGHDFGSPAYPLAQMSAVTSLCRAILSRHPIKPARVLGHSDVAPLRKADPGEWFDWRGLSLAGVGLWVEPEEIIEGPALRPGDRGDPVAELQFQLGSYGYGIEVLGRFDELTQKVVMAFQRHFRPARVDGVADVSTILTLQKLLAAARV